MGHLVYGSLNGSVRRGREIGQARLTFGSTKNRQEGCLRLGAGGQIAVVDGMARDDISAPYHLDFGPALPHALDTISGGPTWRLEKVITCI